MDASFIEEVSRSELQIGRDPLALFCKGDKKRNQTIRRALLRGGLVPYLCAKCGMNPRWQDEDLLLHLDHKNGDPTDNRFGNLRFLCPNCHSQTSTYCGKNRKKSSGSRRGSKRTDVVETNNPKAPRRT